MNERIHCKLLFSSLGVKGKTLSSLVLNIFEQFKEEFEKMSNKKYDPLDPASLVCLFPTLKTIPDFFRLGISR